MTNPRCLAFLSCALLAAAPCDAQLPTARKVVVHDAGDLWPSAFILRSDGSVIASGNPWLGGGRKRVQLEGVADIARLDALTPGAGEAVAMVGSSGLAMVRRNATAGLTITPWNRPELAGALAVRTAPFSSQHLVAVLAADGRTISSYRYAGLGNSGQFAGSFTAPDLVLDYEGFQHQDGSGRLLLLTAAGLSCTLVNGTVLWTLPGSGGDIVRWSGDPATKAAWLHRGGAGRWQVARLGDSGTLGFDDLGDQIGTGEDLIAAFALDCDDDGDRDLVLKTSTGISILLGEAAVFTGAVEQSFGLQAGGVCLPDAIVTHGGERVRLVDDNGAGDVDWTLLAIAFASTAHDIEVRVPAFADPHDVDTKLVMRISLGADYLRRFVSSNSETHLQIVSWRQAEPTLGGRLDEVAERNLLFRLVGVPNPLTGETQWPVTVPLRPPFHLMPTGPVDAVGWETEEHYWLTVRVVRTPIGSHVPDRSSEPITLATSMSGPQRVANWPFLYELLGPGFDPTDPGVLLLPDPDVPQAGGLVVGVITRIVVPPPPTTGIPSPADSQTGPDSAQPGENP